MKLFDDDFKFTTNIKLSITNDAITGMRATGTSDKGVCHLQLWQENDDELESPRIIAIIRDTTNQNGWPSIVESLPDIAAKICLENDIDPFSLFVVEHFDFRDMGGEESFEYAHLPWEGDHFGPPLRDMVCKLDVERLIGESVP